jgi:hypothetical protein
VLAAVTEAEVLGDREPEEEPAPLRDMRDAAARQRRGRDLGGVGAGEEDPPAQRAQQPRDRAQRGRLAGAVGAEQRDDLAGAHVQVEPADDGGAVIAHGQRLDAEHRVAHGTSMSSVSAAWRAPAPPR